jgi:hypothetical protein
VARALGCAEAATFTVRPDHYARAVERSYNVPAHGHATYQTAAVMALPDFPLSVDPVRLQRVVDAMSAFGLLPAKDHSFRVSTMTG